ncbi:MAG: hypothetical protein WC881_02075 [Elusimicrobiota bacterium]|jgi:hypothetical protein
MLELILLASLTPAVAQTPTEPCLWPNTCMSQPIAVNIEPCVWPNTCAQQPAA